MKNLCKQNWYRITLLFLFCVTVFLRFYKLTVLPDVLHVDESALGYNAWCLANYGTDRYLNVLPFYPQNFYGGQSPLYTYLVVLLIKFVGKGNLSLFLVRTPAALGSILLWVAGTKSMALVFENRKMTVAASLFLTFCPYFIMAGRYALDCNLMLCCVACSLLVLLIYLKTGKLLPLLLSGICFGITLYSYALSYLIVPLFLVLISLYMLYHKKITIPRILLWAVSVCITALPVILFACTLLFHTEPIHFLGFTISPVSGNRMEELSFASLGTNLLHNLKITLTYSIYPMDALDKFYTLYPISIPFILLGMLCSVYDFGSSFRKHCFHFSTVYLFYFLCCSFVVALTPTEHLYRANSAYICYLFFFLRGIRACCGFLTVYRETFLEILAFGYLVWVAAFMRYYYTMYSMLDLYTYANSFYFADISDIVTYIDENLEETELYADCVNTEEFLYFYYPISPYERVPRSDLEEEGELPKHYVVDGSTPLLPSTAYIVRRENQEFITHLNDSGFTYHTVEFSPYYLFYFDNYSEPCK